MLVFDDLPLKKGDSPVRYVKSPVGDLQEPEPEPGQQRMPSILPTMSFLAGAVTGYWGK